MTAVLCAILAPTAVAVFTYGVLFNRVANTETAILEERAIRDKRFTELRIVDSKLESSVDSLTDRLSDLATTMAAMQETQGHLTERARESKQERDDMRKKIDKILYEVTKGD